MASRSALVLCFAAFTATGFPSPRASPPPPPPAPPVFEGTVKGPDGKPVEGALVIVRLASPTSETPLSIRTDASGRFRIPAKQRQPHSIRVQARGLAMALFERVSPGAPLTVTLHKGGVIEGVVRDAEGRPLKGARVSALAPGAAVFLPWEPEAGPVIAISDAKGRYRLQGIAPGPHAVSASAPGFGRAQKLNVRAGAVVDLALTPGAWISGTVIGPDGKPVEGVRVRVDSTGGMGGGASLSEVTDKAGGFTVAGLSPGVYDVVAWAKGLAPGVVGGVRVEREAETRTEIVLAKGASLLGRLVDAAERPVTGRIQVQDLEGRAASYSLTEALKTEAGPDGRFVLERVPPGAFTLTALGRGYAPKRIEAEIRPRDAAVDLGDVVLEVGLAIRGRVRTKSGEPIPDAYVSGYLRRSTMAVRQSPETQSDADGSFTVAGLEPGNYELMVAAPGFARTTRTVEAGAQGVDVVLSPGGTITGTVVDTADRPVDSFSARAEATGRYGPGTRGTDGRLEIPDLAEGTYALTVNAPEAQPGIVSGVKVVAGQTTDVGKIRLARGAVLRGVVVDPSGAPVIGARVIVQSASQQNRAPLLAESEAGGAFEIRGAPEGKVDVSAMHPSFASARVSGVDVDPGKEPAEVRVVLSSGGRIEGWARKRDGAPLSGIQVRIQPTEPPFEFTAPVTPQADGSFVAEHVRPGRVVVSLSAMETGRATGIQSREVDVVEGQTTTVDFSVREVLVSGRVRRGGAPLGGVRVNLRSRSSSASYGWGPSRSDASPSGPQRMTAVTAEDGGYELIASEPGPATAAVESLDGKTRFPMRQTEIPDADTFSLDLKFTGVTVSGVVVDKETGQGLVDASVSALPKNREAGAGGATGADGRFTLELEPGDFKVRAGAKGYASAATEVTVDASGASDLRIELLRGLSIRGRVLDGTGRPVGGVMVVASGPESNPSTAAAPTLSDGTFLLEGLQAQLHTLTASAAPAGFAVRPGVTPSDSEVTLRLRPGGRVRATVVDPDGAAAAEAYVRVTKVDAVPVMLMLTGSLRTNAQGVQEMACPAGLVELEAVTKKLKGRATVSVSAGANREVRIVVSEPADVN